MSFYGTEIIFDGVSSKQFGLTLISDSNKSSGGIDVDIQTDKPHGSYNQLMLGVENKNPLEFDLTLVSETDLDRRQLSIIQNWLFGHNQYKKLQIVQSDMHDFYYMCVLNKSEITTSGNYPRIIKFSVVCDSPFAYENNIVQTLNGNGVIANNSDHWDYLYVKSEITCSGGDVTITNVTDNNRNTVIAGRINGEVVSLDGNIGIIKSSNGLRFLDKFNKKFIRLLPGNNTFRVSGASKLKIEYIPIRKVGS